MGQDGAVLIAYVDESYDQDFYYLGAAVAPQDAWHDLDDAFQEIRDRATRLHNTPTNVEFHAHPLMGGVGDWGPLRGRHREAGAIYRSALAAAREVGVRYIFRGVDVRRLNARYSYPRPPHEIVFRHLLERINDYTVSKDPTGNECIVVADEIATQEQHREQFAGYQVVGTGGYRPSTLPRISAPVQFAQSSSVSGLQAIDLAIYLHRRRELVVEANPRARQLSNRLWREVEPNVWHAWSWRP